VGPVTGALSPATGSPSPFGPGIPGATSLLKAGGAWAAAAAGLAGLSSLLASAAAGSGAGMPMSPSPALPRLPAGSGGGANGGTSPEGGVGGHGERGMQYGAGAALVAHRTLVLLRLVRRAAAKAIWRSYLPEVPPA
jgi:hypothetical protein